MQDAVGLWQHLLDQIYHYKVLDSFTGNAPKSIKQYVLEEAPELVYSFSLKQPLDLNSL